MKKMERKEKGEPKRKTKTITFRPDDDVLRKLSEVTAWGERSWIINEALRLHGAEAFAALAEQELMAAHARCQRLAASKNPTPEIDKLVNQFRQILTEQLPQSGLSPRDTHSDRRDSGGNKIPPES